MLRLPLRLMQWMLRRLARTLQKKGALYLLAMVVFMSVDMIFPWLGGSLTTVIFVLGPAILMGLTFGVLKRLDGTMPQFLALSSYMSFCGLYALFRAWSKAADSSLPDVLGPLARWTFGPLWNAAAGAVAALFGYAQAVPMPVWGPLPFGEHLLAMDPLLTGLSLLVLAWSLRIFLYGVRRYGGETQRSEDEKKLALNGMTRLWLSNWVLLGVWGNIKRQLRLMWQRPGLAPDQIVVGFGAPVLTRPWAWPWYGLCSLVSKFWSTEFSIFDVRRMVVASAGNGALILGGAGAGKTLLQIMWLQYSRSPKILIETQGNVFEKDAPLIHAAGRKLRVISTDLGLDTVSVNVLPYLDPANQDYWDQVMELSGRIIQVRGEHSTLERCTREVLACIVGNVVYFARIEGDVPTLDTAYSFLTDPELTEDLAFWVQHGHPDFRNLCQTSLNRALDPEFLNSLAAIYSPELGFLDHPVKRAMVCAGSSQVLDPADMLDDPTLDVAIQISQATIDLSGALLRLLLGALLAPRVQLTKEQAARTRAPGVTVWIDELAAFAGPTPGSGAIMLKEIVDFHRQKNVRWVFAAQNKNQIEDGWGPGTYAKWANSAMVRIFGKVGAEPELDQHITEVAGKTLQEKIEKIPGAGGGWRAYQIVRVPIDLLPSHVLSKVGVDQMIAFVRTEKHGLIKLKLWRPAYFAHSVAARRFARAQRRFGGRPATKSPNANRDLIAAGRETMAELQHRAQEMEEMQQADASVAPNTTQEAQPNAPVKPSQKGETPWQNQPV